MQTFINVRYQKLNTHLTSSCMCIIGYMMAFIYRVIYYYDYLCFSFNNDYFKFIFFIETHFYGLFSNYLVFDFL